MNRRLKKRRGKASKSHLEYGIYWKAFLQCPFLNLFQLTSCSEHFFEALLLHFLVYCLVKHKVQMNLKGQPISRNVATPFRIFFTPAIYFWWIEAKKAHINFCFFSSRCLKEICTMIRLKLEDLIQFLHSTSGFTQKGGLLQESGCAWRCLGVIGLVRLLQIYFTERLFQPFEHKEV